MIAHKVQSFALAAPLDSFSSTKSGPLTSQQDMATLGLILATVAIFVAPSMAMDKIPPQLKDSTCGYAGWYYFEGHCYQIDPIGTVAMAWQAAADFCPTAHAGNFKTIFL